MELKRKRGTEDAASDKNQGKAKKKRWRKGQQAKARKDAKKRKPTEQEEATQRREEEHRGTMKPTQVNKWQAKAPDPGAQQKEQKPKAKVILRSRSRGKGNTLDPKGDPIPKEY